MVTYWSLPAVPVCLFCFSIGLISELSVGTIQDLLPVLAPCCSLRLVYLLWLYTERTFSEPIFLSQRVHHLSYPAFVPLASIIKCFLGLILSVFLKMKHVPGIPCLNSLLQLLWGSDNAPITEVHAISWYTNTNIKWYYNFSPLVTWNLLFLRTSMNFSVLKDTWQLFHTEIKLQSLVSTIQLIYCQLHSMLACKHFKIRYMPISENWCLYFLFFHLHSPSCLFSNLSPGVIRWFFAPVSSRCKTCWSVWNLIPSRNAFI